MEGSWKRNDGSEVGVRVGVDDKDKHKKTAEGLECLMRKKLTERDSERGREKGQD